MTGKRAGTRGGAAWLAVVVCAALLLAVPAPAEGQAQAQARDHSAMPPLPRPAPRELRPRETRPREGRLDAESASSGLVACDPALTSRHNPGLVAVSDRLYCFRGWISNFDTEDDDDGDGAPDLLGLPEWVAQRVERAQQAPESGERPGAWNSIPELLARRIAPGDDSYRFSQAFRAARPDWYQRGHLAQKYLLERVGPEAGRFSHNLANAVPQRARFNRGPWLALECLTGAWANRYGRIWVVAGPVFLTGRPTAWLHEQASDALPVAIPDALFKLVARQRDQRSEAREEPAEATAAWRLLSFVYPQQHDSYQHDADWPPERWLASLARIEALTGQRFLPDLAPAEAEPLKRAVPRKLWPVARGDFDPGCRRFARDLE